MFSPSGCRTPRFPFHGPGGGTRGRRIFPLPPAPPPWTPPRHSGIALGQILLAGGIPWRIARLYRLGVIDESAIRQRYEALAPVLDERGRRRFAAAEASSAGHGGVVAVMRATGIARSTIGRGLAEL